MKTTTEYVREGMELQERSGTSSRKALERYQKAIKAYAVKEDEEYAFLYANYQTVLIYGSDIYNHIYGEPDLQEMVKMLPYAHRCLELVKDASAHSSETKSFYEEVIRNASYGLAWYAYKQLTDKSELEKALETISLGCKYAESSLYIYMFAIKAHLLLKLSREEESFTIVDLCLKKYPGHDDFSDIQKSKAYRQWKERLIDSECFSIEEKEILQKAARITATITKTISDQKAGARELTEIPSPKEIIPLAITRGKQECFSGDDDDSLLLFKGNLYINGDLDQAWLDKQLENIQWKNDLMGIVIAEDLEVGGDITCDVSLLVEKDLTCNYLYTHDCHIEVSGNARIKYGIYGQYNDGTLTIKGRVNCPYFISNDHCMPRKSDDGESIYIEAFCLDINNVEIEGLVDSAKLLLPAVFDENKEENEEGYLSIDTFFSIVKEGKNPFRHDETLL